MTNNLQAKAVAAQGKAIIDPADMKAQKALQQLEETLIKGASEGEKAVMILELDPRLTNSWFLLRLWLIKPKKFLNFGPYETVWNRLEEQGLRPFIRLNWYSDVYTGFSWSFPAIWCRIPKMPE